MRDIFIDELIIATKKNKNIILLVNDLGFGVIEKFCRLFPNNYFNAGISEQSMMGYAAAGNQSLWPMRCVIYQYLYAFLVKI